MLDPEQRSQDTSTSILFMPPKGCERAPWWTGTLLRQPFSVPIVPASHQRYLIKMSIPGLSTPGIAAQLVQGGPRIFYLKQKPGETLKQEVKLVEYQDSKLFTLKLKSTHASKTTRWPQQVPIDKLSRLGVR